MERRGIMADGSLVVRVAESIILAKNQKASAHFCALPLGFTAAAHVAAVGTELVFIR